MRTELVTDSLEYICPINILFFIKILVYIDAGAACSNTATLAFTFTNAQSRQFDIKVSQIPCGSEYT